MEFSNAYGLGPAFASVTKSAFYRWASFSYQDGTGLYVNPSGGTLTVGDWHHVAASWNRNGWDDPSIAYSNNPYWSRYKNFQNDTRDRLYGNIGTRINLLEGLKFQYKLNLDFFSDKQYERSAVYSQELSRFYEAHRQQHEINHEAFLLFDAIDAAPPLYNGPVRPPF